jgi:spermidine synthase
MSAPIGRERAIQLLLPLFFVSGATGLCWQTLWARELHLVFGTSTLAIATVLSAFMLGLALGGFAAARWADRVARPLAAYGWLEVGIGAYALVFPLILSAITPLYLTLGEAFAARASGGSGFMAFGFAQFVLVGAALVAPTTLMGATLPLLARFATDRLGAAGNRVGQLYAVNTAGAVFGTWFTGFWLLPGLGKAWTVGLCAVANLALGAGAIVLSRRSEDNLTAEDDLAQPLPRSLFAVSVAMALGGFASLIYEVAWTRLLVLMLGASVYAFSVMLLAFLSGIAFGGWVGGVASDAVLRRWSPGAVLVMLAATELGIGALSYGLMWVFPELPFWYVAVFDLFEAEKYPALVWPASMAIAVVVMTPPAVLMGVAFPAAVRAVLGDRAALGEPVGGIYGANTLGGVAGAALAGFVLLPMLGVQGTVYLGIAANLAAAVVLGVHHALSRSQRLVVVAVSVALSPILVGAVLRPPWNPLLMTAGMYKYVSEIDDHSRAAIYRYAVQRYNLLFYEEGLSSVVTVAQNPETGNIWLANNGKVDASTSLDMPTQILVALLPFQFRPEATDTMVIGLASGITAGATTQVDTLQRIDVVELEPAILRAARFFDDHNHHVLDDPRVTMFANDGRNQVLLSEPGRYDVIVSEPSNPWISGVSNLFTREFFELGRSRLKPGGVWSQWVQMYGMDEDDLRSLIGTFTDVYPHVLLFATIEDADLVLVGSDAPLDLDRDRVASWLSNHAGVRNELTRIGMGDAETLYANLLMTRPQLVAFSEGVARNTDDSMRIEYNAPRNLHIATSANNVAALLVHAEIPSAAFHDDPASLAKLARLYIARDDSERSLRAMALAFRGVCAQLSDQAAACARVAAIDTADEKKAALAVMQDLFAARMAQTGASDPLLEDYAAWRDEVTAWAKENQ